MFNVEKKTSIEWDELPTVSVRILFVKSGIASITPEDSMEVRGPILYV
jgi:hypothetical protein